jgi:glycosyltransferase involved in cell wall biosynthesis
LHLVEAKRSSPAPTALSAAKPEESNLERPIAMLINENLDRGLRPPSTPLTVGFGENPLAVARQIENTAIHSPQYTANRRDTLDIVAAPKVPVIFTSPTWQMNGVNVFTANLARGLGARGRRSVIVLTEPHKDEPIPMPRPTDLEFVELETSQGDPMIQRWRSLCSTLERNRPCVYFPNYDWHTSCVAPRLSSEIGIVGVVHSDDPRHYEHLERLGDCWNATVAVSDRIGRVIQRTRPETSSRLRVIPIGVKIPDHPRKQREPRAQLRVIYSGLLNRFQKRIFDVAAIADELERRDVPFTLTFCGGGEDEDELRDSTRDLVANKRVRFTGVLGPDQLAVELSKHDVFVLTSEFEGLPNALLEAMAHGLVPVVSEIESGIPEVVHDHRTGLTSPVGDINRFADCLTGLWREPQLLRSLSERARATIVDGPYNLEHMIDSYSDLVDQVAREATATTFRRPRGGVRPPSDLGPLWRHYVPQPLRLVWRWIRRTLPGRTA